MIIIWGSRGITSTLGSGSFRCPGCKRKTDYFHKQVRPFFTIYFIPIFPTGAGQRYVECTRCQNVFYEHVLEGGGVQSDNWDREESAPAAPELADGENDGSTSWKVNDRVLARWKPDNFWYSGVVAACSKGMVSVEFDDGQTDTVRAREVCEIDIDVGSRVFARTPDNPGYYPATVENMKGEYLFIRFDDGHPEESHLSLLRVLR